MEKLCSLWNQDQPSAGPSACPARSFRGSGRLHPYCLDPASYHLQGKTPETASVGEEAPVQRRQNHEKQDHKNRSAIHHPHAYGHPGIKALLVKRKCEADACDDDSSTALVTAHRSLQSLHEVGGFADSQWQLEECEALLLKKDADKTISSNVTLHHTVCSKNTSKTAQLLSNNSDAVGEDKEGLIPLLLAVKELKQTVVDFLQEKKANAHIPEEQGRPRKRTSKEKHKITKQENTVNDVPDFSYSSALDSEDCSGSLLEVPDEAYSNGRVMELEASCHERLSERNENTEHQCSDLENELPEGRVTSQSWLDGVKGKKDFCGLIFSLKEEDKAIRNAHLLYEKIMENFRKEKEQQLEEPGLSQHEICLRTKVDNLKNEENNSNKLQEAWHQCAEVLEDAEQMRDTIQRLELENSKLIITGEHQARKVEELQEKLLSAHLALSEDKEQLHEFDKLKSSLKHTSEDKKKKYDKLEKKPTRFKKHFKMTKKINKDENGECSCHGDLETSQSEIDTDSNMLNYETEVISEENSENIRENPAVLAVNQLELKSLQSKLSKMEIEDNSCKIEVEKYKELYLKELRSNNDLFSHHLKSLHRTCEYQLGLCADLEEMLQKPCALAAPVGSLVPECPWAAKLHHSSSNAGENLEAPSQSPGACREFMADHVSRREDEDIFIKELIDSIRSLQHASVKEMERTDELHKQLIQFKKLLNMLQEKEKEHDDRGCSLQRFLKFSPVEMDIPVTRPRQEAEAAARQDLEWFPDLPTASLIMQMELEIKTLESEISEVQTEERSVRKELDEVKQLYRGELKRIDSMSLALSTSVQSTKERDENLAQVGRTRSGLSTTCARPGP